MHIVAGQDNVFGFQAGEGWWNSIFSRQLELGTAVGI
jgi:hypothetical protein